ncbi:hypothetical protein FRACA_910007 [Frankia canadensis]|uniref:Uncharacterized protein n=1 Tax=Frankia canadensis TaxID=1836972 RepID=A0A2I2L2G7_9ACTN|nr:hypothetical protein FRACA_910007 [Frankia canadensis]SOU59385.1 hypothetical protein FRACA_910007 [Frankia canadensis]
MKNLIRRQGAAAPVGMTRRPANRCASAPSRLPRRESGENRTWPRSGPDGKSADQIAAPRHGVSGRTITQPPPHHHSMKTMRVPFIQRVDIAGRHRPAGTRMRHHERIRRSPWRRLMLAADPGQNLAVHSFGKTGYQCGDPGNGAGQILRYLHGSHAGPPDRQCEGFSEPGQELAIGDRICGAMRISATHRFHQPPCHRRRRPSLSEPLRMSQQRDRENGVGIHVIDVHGELRRLKAEQNRVLHLPARCTRHQTNTVTMMVEAEPLTLNIQFRTLHNPVKRDTPQRKLGERDGQPRRDDHTSSAYLNRHITHAQRPHIWRVS